MDRLDRSRFEPVLILLQSSPWLEKANLSCRTVCLDYRGMLKLSFPSCILRLARLIRAEEIDILQTFFEDAVFVGCFGVMASRRRTALVASRRDLGLGREEPWYHSLFRAAFPWVIRRYDGVAVNAEAISRYLQQQHHVAAGKIRVIPNGLQLSAGAAEPLALFRNHAGALWVGIVANLQPVKRIDVFLKGIALALQEAPELDLRGVVLGEGEERDRLLALAGDLGLSSRVHFVGSVDNVGAYLRHLDMAVLCSDREGLSNAVMEYMAHGLPAVVTAVGGNPELIDTSTGICIPPGSAELLGQALVRLARSPGLRQNLGSQALNRVRERFSWERVMPQWEEYYRSLVSAQG